MKRQARREESMSFSVSVYLSPRFFRPAFLMLMLVYVLKSGLLANTLSAEQSAISFRRFSFFGLLLLKLVPRHSGDFLVGVAGGILVCVPHQVKEIRPHCRLT
uniref:(northern house mosquito) hypothetical protein n=1 Tax=Culex pipiens TaxID=7175 RepID=A0A8D8GIG5_CULPI